MDHSKVKSLQAKLVQEAAAILALAGSEGETAPYEQAITLVGKAWGQAAEETAEHLALIQQEKEAIRRIEQGEPAEHIMPDRDILLNWSGLECLEVLESLFETVTRLDATSDRTSLFNMAMTLMECQNLLDWVEKTDGEKKSSKIIAS